MLRASTPKLDYFDLVKQARRLAPTGGRRTLRIALLGDASVQQLAPLLRVLVARGGVDAEVFEGPYDAVATQALDPASELHAFGAGLIVLLNATGKLRDRYYARPEGADFVGEEIAAVVRTWAALGARSKATLIQTTYVLPYERPFGSYGLKVSGTLQGAAREINRGIAEAARQHAHVLLEDLDDLASWVGRRQWFDERLWQLSKSICGLEHLPLVAQRLADIALASVGVALKCAVLDLDNTLWGGILGDDGLDGIRLGELDDGPAFRTFQRYLRDLSRRGIILAVCSKNDHDNALRVFREHPDMVLREEDIAVFMVNWENKARNIQLIAETLNIGLDAMVFLDDSPFERNLVRELLPAVTVPELPEDPADYVKALVDFNLFETTTHSAFDAERARSYREQAVRQRDMQAYASLDEYLASLGTVAVARPWDAFHLPRIAQLIQRSNQFNLTTRRYGQAECEALAADGARHFTLQISVRDRVGDFGLILAAVLRFDGTDAVIDLFLMSCRVLSRGVEQLAMNRLVEEARARGATRLIGHYLPTAKNGMVKSFFVQFGFTRTAEDERGNTTWEIDPRAYTPHRVHIERIENIEPLSSARGDAPTPQTTAQATTNAQFDGNANG